jgi:PIN domain nuclease of toxin-antitoxin system
MSSYLLDTHALIWWMEGTKLSCDVVETLNSASKDTLLLWAPVSFWEMGILDAKQTYTFLPSFEIWSQRAIAQSGALACDLSAKAAILSSRLPSNFHKDPADRLLVASAIDAGATFVTRDTKILGWAERTGAMKVLAI